MAYENGLTHFDKSGQAIMVDVSEKKETSRTAIASGRIRVNRAVYEAIEQGTAKKGDVLGTARIAGIMAAKNTSAVIPLPIAKCSVDFTMLPEECAVEARATVKVTGQTGVEMEALHSVSVALLTIYDMCKALDKGMEIEFIHLDKKTGGKSGIYLRSESSEKERTTQQTE